MKKKCKRNAARVPDPVLSFRQQAPSFVASDQRSASNSSLTSSSSSASYNRLLLNTSSTKMLRQLARPLTRRALHTSSSSARAAAVPAPTASWRAAHYAFGASAAASALLAWQLNQKPIMLEADAPAKGV
jgi:hypothetical protein